jgi:putative transposase
MRRAFQPFLFLLAPLHSERIDSPDPIAQAENERLRKHFNRKQIFLDQNEKSRLIKLDQAIGSDLKHIITIVSYNTYLLWLRKKIEGFRPKKMGHPRTAESIRNLIHEDRHRDRLGDCYGITNGKPRSGFQRVRNLFGRLAGQTQSSHFA